MAVSQCLRIHVAILSFLSLCLALADATYASSSSALPLQLPISTYDAASITVGDDTFEVFAANPHAVEITSHWKDANNRLYSTLGAVKKTVEASGRRLLFATNGGIFDTQRRPEGLYIEEYKELRPLNTADGNGNFYLKPNGVLWFDKEGCHIAETGQFRAHPGIRLAMQSGPLLLGHGVINAHFKPDSANRYIRNGVGIRNTSEIFFAISKRPVNFHTFASFFKDRLGCNDALYLDGLISQMYLPVVGRYDESGIFAAIIGVALPPEKQ